MAAKAYNREEVLDFVLAILATKKVIVTTSLLPMLKMNLVKP